jgi:probable HAF family extracellular repeat protein
MRDLGTLGGGFSFGYAINDSGQVVGWTSVAENPYQHHAFVTGPDGVGMTDLNSLVHLLDGWVLIEARGINNAGQVIALGTVAFIPEPESYALLLAGLALIGAVAWRKKDTRPLPA